MPGHQSLLVKLPKTGALLLSRDAVHFKENWDKRRIPEFNSNRSSVSAQRLADIMVKQKAQVRIKIRRSAMGRSCRPISTSERRVHPFVPREVLDCIAIPGNVTRKTRC